MKLKQLKERTPELKSFEKKEWKIANEQNFGHDFGAKKSYLLVAEDDGKIVGLVEFNTTRGVCHISNLLVSNSSRRQGIGKKLLTRAEKKAKQLKVHKIFLNTGKDWESVKFYNSMGYQVEAVSKNHYGHHDFVQFVKFL